jgi:hypothetical protein
MIMALSKIQLINFFKELAPYTSQCSSPFYASVELVPQKTHLFKIVIEAELTTEGDHELEVITGYKIVLADFTEVVFKLNEQPEYDLTQREYEKLLDLVY